MNQNRVTGVVVALALLCPLDSIAAQADIVNSGFEAISLPDPEGWSDTAPGWTVEGVAGSYNPSELSMPGAGGVVPEGSNMAFVNAGSLFQTLSTRLTENSVYTLNVDVVKRLQPEFQSASYLIELLAGETVIAEDANSLSPASGTFETSTLFYNALSGDLLAGNFLGIRLSGFGAQTGFDNVSLDASSAPPLVATPIPAAFPLFGSALGLLGFAGWKRKKNA